MSVVSSMPGTADLLVPKTGVIDSYAFRLAPQDLIDGLRGLADAVEAATKPKV